MKVQVGECGFFGDLSPDSLEHRLCKLSYRRFGPNLVSRVSDVASAAHLEFVFTEERVGADSLQIGVARRAISRAR